MAKLQGHDQVLKLLKENEILEGVNISFNIELGRGSYAAVYQAEWRGLSCVAKVFHAVIFPNYPAETWKQLAREIELLQNMRHPNIVQLLGFIPETKSKIPSIVMERLDTNLTTLIKEHHSSLSFDTQVCILHDVAVGLNFLHGHKEPIIHRDLSSNNILVTEHLVAKISDLGLARHIQSVEQQTGSFAGFGTQDYMPPEVLGQKPPQISPKTDVFSFGVVMLQVATGKPPEVRGRLNVDAEVDRRKHHFDLLSENSFFRPLVLQCLSESIHRPNASMLCEATEKFGVVRKSTLKLTKGFHEEMIKVTKQLEAEKEVQNKLYDEIAQLKYKATEAIEATECQSSIAKQLVQQNQELTKLLETTNNDLNTYKKSFSVLRELFESLNKEHVPSDNVDDKIQKCKNDGKKLSVKLQDMETRLLPIKQSIQGEEKSLPTSMSAATQEGHHSDLRNKVEEKILPTGMSATTQEGHHSDLRNKVEEKSLPTGMSATIQEGHHSDLRNKKKHQPPIKWKSCLALSDDDVTTCPLCNVTLGNENELQLHYLQSCAGYDNEVTGDPMSIKPMGLHPPATQQSFGGSYDRSSDRLASSNKETTVSRSRTAVGRGDGNFSGLRRLVKFVWFPNDPFKVHEVKATLLSSFTAGESSVKLFKDKYEDVGAFSSSMVSVRIGKFDDGQIIIGEEILEVEPYEVSNDSEEIYLIDKGKYSPGPPPVKVTTTSGVSPPHNSSDPYHGMNQMTAPTVPQFYGEWSAMMGADMMGHQEFTRHSRGRSTPSYSEDTGAAMQPYMNQNFGQQFSRQPVAGQLYGQHSFLNISELEHIQPSKRTGKSVIKQVETANGKQDVSCEPVSLSVAVKKGQRVVVCRANNSTEYGTIRAVNVTIDTKKGFIGVEMDLPSGNTDGEVRGVRHFRCKPKHGVFVPLKNIFKIRSGVN